MTINLSKIKELNIPTNPGSYQFYNCAGDLLYIGKASNLRSRISSYWREATEHSPAKQSMVQQIAKINWIETESEIEALLLEANLIKKHQPPFNILMRDDKRYAYIKISTEDEYPRVFLSRQIDKSGKYFGPFTSTEAIKETLKIIRKIWPYRSCKNLPKKSCLYYRINKCPGVCEKIISPQEYKKIIHEIILFFDGKKKNIIREYEKNIKILEKKNTNENQLNILRYQLRKLNTVIASSRIVDVSEKYSNDVIELAKILNLTKIPQRIEGYDISNIFGREAVGSMVVFADGEADTNQYRKFKIQTVAADKGGDVAMLFEMLDRRFKHASETSNDKWPMPDLIVVDGGKAQLGVIAKILKKYKLNITFLGITKGEGLRSAHAPDKLFFPEQKKPLELPLASPALHLIKRVRDEAHRFAIGYHRKLRHKKLYK